MPRRILHCSRRIESLEARCLLAADGVACVASDSAPRELVAEGEQNLSSSIADAINQFNSVFYDRLEDDSGNLFYSPLSLAFAFGMLYEGADDVGREEIAELFRFEALGDQLHPAFDLLMDRLNAAPAEAQQEIEGNQYFGDPPDPTQLAINNAFFTQQGGSFLEPYRELLTAHYDALQEDVDFLGDPDAAAERINQWASDATEGRIEEIIKPYVAKDLAALLANAVYFKNPWARPFPEDATQTRPFQLHEGGTVDAEMMQQISAFPYMEADGFQVVELPHEFGRFSSVFILPNDPADIDSSSLPSDLDGWLEGLRSERVSVALPKFKMEMSFPLNDALQELGVNRVFHDDDVLPRMGPGLFVDYVRQDTFFEIDEHGSEAAAVTSIGIRTSASIDPPDPKSFHANRPFHFLIRDNESGAIMFMGRQMNPSQEGLTDAPVIASPAESPWHNGANPYDVDQSGTATINDALMIVSQLRMTGPRMLSEGEEAAVQQVTLRYDVNNDGMLSLSDAIATARHVSVQMAFAAAAAEGEMSDDDSSEDTLLEDSVDLLMSDLGEV